MCQAKIIKHKADCKMAFGRKDPTCQRCQELLAGAPARTRFGANTAWYELKKKNDANTARWLKEHDCAKAGCGPICTYGDW